MFLQWCCSGIKIYYIILLNLSIKNRHQAGIRVGGGSSTIFEDFFSRLNFLYHHGYLPRCVDHKDGNTLNNQIENLREATHSQNSLNSKFRISNTSGYKNVHYVKRNQKWRVMMKIRGVNKSCGCYDDLELAGLVAAEARDKFCGQYARHI